jgi:hypothetical protein
MLIFWVQKKKKKKKKKKRKEKHRNCYRLADRLV